MSEQNQRALRLGAIVAEAARRVKLFWEYADAHEGATIETLERRAEALSRGLLASVVVEVVMERSAAIVEVDCPRCGARMQYKGQQKRTQESLAGTVSFERGYYYCGHCHEGHYPLDEQLQIPAGQFAPGVQEEVSRLAAEMPFGRAAETFTALKGTSISARQVARIAEARGSILGQQRAVEDEQLAQGMRPPEAKTWDEEGVRGVGLDAAMAHFRDGWHEVKVGVVFDTRVEADEGDMHVRAVGQHYLAHIGTMETTCARLYAEAIRQGYQPERETVVCLADGAPSNWQQFAEFFAPRVEILDWYHATQHLWAASNGLYGEKSTGAAEWVEAREAELWTGHVTDVIQALQAAAEGPHGEAAQAEIGYFSHNQGRMHYDQYRENGYPVGSGVVESACKQLVSSRLCGAGMWWSQKGAQAILNLRAALLSHDWAGAWALTSRQAGLPKS